MLNVDLFRVGNWRSVASPLQAYLLTRNGTRSPLCPTTEIVGPLILRPLVTASVLPRSCTIPRALTLQSKRMLRARTDHVPALSVLAQVSGTTRQRKDPHATRRNQWHSFTGTRLCISHSLQNLPSAFSYATSQTESPTEMTQHILAGSLSSHPGHLTEVRLKPGMATQRRP